MKSFSSSFLLLLVQFVFMSNNSYSQVCDSSCNGNCYAYCNNTYENAYNTLCSIIDDTDMNDIYRMPIYDNNDIAIHANIAYGTATDWIDYETELLLDAYIPPKNQDILRPVVIVLHGGTFITGHRQNLDIVAYCDSLARRGYVAIAPDYRLGYNLLNRKSAIRAIYRSVQDVRAAIRFIKHHHEIASIDTNQIFLLGQSGGAIAALHTVFMDDSEKPEEAFGLENSVVPREVKSDLGCLDCSGNTLPHSSKVAGIISNWGGISHIDYLDEDERIPIQLTHAANDWVLQPTHGEPFFNFFSGHIGSFFGNDCNILFPDLFGSASIQEHISLSLIHI